MRRWLGCALALSLGLFGCGDDGPNGGEPPEGGLPDVDVPDVVLDGSPDATPDGSPGDGAADGGDGSAPDGATDGSTQPPAEPWYVLSAERAGPFVILSDDGREFERIAIASEAAGSARGVEAGEGVFYFEMQTLVSDRRQRFGVGPDDMPLEGDVGDPSRRGQEARRARPWCGRSARQSRLRPLAWCCPWLPGRRCPPRASGTSR